MSPETPECIEKLMGLTHAEFQHSIAGLAPSSLENDGRVARFVVSNGTVTVTFEALPHAILGGLVRMPRSKVTLAFDGVDTGERARFLRRFDIVFQRGGG